MTRTRRQLAAALLTAAVGAVGWGQTVSPPAQPAARLLPARPVESAIVTRGYAPEPNTFGDTRPPIKTLSEQRTWTGAPVNAAAADPRRQPAPAPTPPPAVPTHTTGAGGVYAGPPAYRWYGYGTTTPGANPLAPTGQYPKGSANWYAQTGATPGAFPVPVTAGGEPVPRFEPPAYAAAPAPVQNSATAYSSVPTYPATARDTRPAPSFVPPSQPAPSRTVSTALPPPKAAASPTVVPPPAAPVITLPAAPLVEAPRPSDEPKPIAVSAPATPATSLPPVVAGPKPDLPPSPAPTSGLTWQPQATSRDAALFTAAKPPEPIATSATPALAPSVEVPQPFRPPTVAVDPPPAPALPTIPAPPADLPPAVLPPVTDWKAAPQARGQQPTTAAVSLDAQVRNACYGLATVAAVTHTGPSSLTVRLTATSDADARTAAASVAKLAALRPYTVRFDIELTAR